MKHLDENIILELITSESLNDEVKAHLESCDKCFTNYYSTKGRYLEMMNAETQETPLEYLLEAEKKLEIDGAVNLEDFSISEGTTTPQEEKPYNVEIPIAASQPGNTVTMPIFQYQYAALATTMAALVFIVYLNFNNLASSGLSSTYDFRTTSQLRSGPLSIIDFSTSSLEEIIQYAEENSILLEIKYSDEFAQNHQPSYYFNTKTDTLKIELPK